MVNHRLHPRTFLAILCCLALLLITGLLHPVVPARAAVANANATNINWPTFGFNARHTHVNPFENTINTSNVSSLVPEWQVSLASFDTSPAVVNGIVYAGSTDGNMYAFNASTGATLWKYNIGGDRKSSPAVVNGVVYVGSGKVGSGSSHVYALNATSGSLIWRFSTLNQVDSSPTVVNNVVYAEDRTDLYAINATTGAKVWKRAFNGPLYGSPTVSGGILVVGSDSGFSFGLNASTGKTMWSLATGNSNDVLSPTAAIVSGVAYIGYGNMDSNGSGCLSGDVYAVNVKTGHLLWHFSVPDGCLSTDPAVVNGVVYIGTAGGDVYAINATNGTLKWSAPATGLIFDAPAVANGVVYVGTQSTTQFGFQAFDASTGAQLWSPAVTSTSPVIVNGVVYVTDWGSSTFYAYHLPSA